jgi:endonuclease/exonuclease/phosphatase family metal-dependent hydrolase
VDPVILLGDFNAVAPARPYRALTATLRDAQKTLKRRTHKTFPSRAPMLRIDHLFVSPEIHVLDVFAPYEHLTRRASDHLPLVMDFEVA